MVNRDEILRFVSDVKKEGRTCLPNKMKVYAPTQCGDNPKHDCTRFALQLRSDLNEIFGGSTMWDGEGSWFNPDTRELIVEPVKVVEVAHNCADFATAQKMAKAITDYAVSASQHSISVDRGNFYILSTPQIAEAAKKFRALGEPLEKFMR